MKKSNPHTSATTSKPGATTRRVTAGKRTRSESLTSTGRVRTTPQATGAPIQRKSAATVSPATERALYGPFDSSNNIGAQNAPLPSSVLSPTGTGSAMPAPLLNKMEGAFDTSFADVRVHVDNSAEDIGAQAYSRGTDVHISPSHYDPVSQAGQSLIGHELVHVVQQRAGRVATPQGKDAAINADPKLEREADVLGDRAARGESVRVSGATASGGTQLKVIQRRTYKQLSDSQQSQVDAVAEDVHRIKSETFETRLGVVSAADARGDQAGTQILTAIVAGQTAAGNLVGAAATTAQLGAAPAAKAAYIATSPTAPSPAVTATHTETVNQTMQAPPGHELVGGNLWDMRPAVPLNLGVANQINTEQKNTLDATGRPRPDSQYATEADNAQVRICGTASDDASVVFQGANAMGVSLPNTKVLVMGWLLAAGQFSFHEIMIAAHAVGMPYAPGPGMYDPAGGAGIAPLTQAELERHLPTYFQQPRFLNQLARVFFPDNPADATAAAARIPADLHVHLGNLSNNFQGLRSDAEIQPLLNVGIARVQVDQLPAAAFNPLLAFVNLNTINGLNAWAAVQAHAAYVALHNHNPSMAELVYGHLFRQQHPVAAAALQNNLAGAQHALRDAPPIVPGGNLGFAPADFAATTAAAHATAASYGAHDRGVNMGTTAATLGAANLTDGEATSIREYTTNGFGTWHGLLGAGASSAAVLTALGAAPGGDAVARLHAAKSGMQKLPPYAGRVFRGTGQPHTTNVAQMQAALNAFSVGSVREEKIFLSAAKTAADSFIVPLDYAFVIDDIKTGRDIQLLAEMPREREVLFEPHARFVITRVENQLTPVAPPGAAAHVFTGGNIWVYMKEISAQKSAPEAAARDAAFQAEADDEIQGRRLVDNAMYDDADAQYETEAKPTAEPKHRFGVAPGVNYGAQPASLVPNSATFTAWQNADTYMQARLGNPLTGVDIQQMHVLAAAPLAGVAGGVLRVGGVDRIGAGGLGPGGHWSALTAAEFAALTANPHIALTHVNAMGVAIPPGKHCVAIMNYPLGANVAGLIAPWLATYAGQFVVLAAMAPGAAKNDAVSQHAALAQKSFISIHPFEDGNGRVSRLIMDHVLMSFGLSAAIVADPNQDTMLDDAGWIAQVRQGVNRTNRVAAYYNG